MMVWNSGRDAVMAGECDAAMLAAGEMGLMLGEMSARRYLRFSMPDGGRAYLRATDGGFLVLACIVPSSEPDDTRPYVEFDELHAKPWPKAWLTKLNTQAKPDKTKDYPSFVVGEFACGVCEDGQAVLARVKALDGAGGLELIQTMVDAPDTRAASHTAKKWFALSKWREGCEAVFERDRCWFHNYRLLTMVLGLAQKRHDKGKARD